MDRQIEERAAHYSFNIESPLFNALPKELQAQWKQDIEQAYRAGAQEELENPTGGQLLYVCSKSSERGRKDCLQTLWYYPEIAKPQKDRNCLIEMIDGHIYVGYWDGKTWFWYDGFPVGKGENGDILYSSSCGIDKTYEVKRWCYVQHLFPENERK